LHPGAKLDELAAGSEGDSGAGVADAIGGENAKNAAGGDGLASVRLHQNRLFPQENMGGSAGGGGVGGGFLKPARKEEEGEQVLESGRREEILLRCPPDVVVFFGTAHDGLASACALWMNTRTTASLRPVRLG
jgi:hypothetical protein